MFSFYKKVLCYLCQITLEDLGDILVPGKLQTLLQAMYLCSHNRHNPIFMKNKHNWLKIKIPSWNHLFYSILSNLKKILKAWFKNLNQINKHNPLPKAEKIVVKIQTEYQLGPDKAKQVDDSNEFLFEYTFAHLCSRVKNWELFWNRNGDYMTCCLKCVSKLAYNYQINLRIY